MAQFSNTIGSLPIQAGIPAGWTKQAGTVDVAVVANAETQYSDRAITFDNMVSSTTLTWNIPGVLGDSEILALQKYTGPAPFGTYYYTCGIRLQAGAESGYFLGLINSSNGGGSTIRLARIDGGSVSAELANASFTWTTETWYWVRLRATGTSIQAKIWQVGGAEPGAFQLSATSSVYPTGRLGIRCRSNSVTPVTANFWAASAGETAVRGNTLSGSALLALSSSLPKAAPGIQWNDNSAKLGLSSVWKARFVAKPVNATVLLAATATFVTREWMPTKWTAESVQNISSSITANAFIPYKSLPKHYEGDRYRRRFEPDYNDAMNDLLPTGPAWPREPETTFQKAVAGLSAFWGSTVEQLAELLLVRESDPRSTVVLLPDWERAWGLPDKCLAEPLTIQDRQIALVHKMTLIGAQSRDFFIGVAASIGYKIDIREWSPFMCGISMCGDTRNLLATEAVSTVPNFNVSSDITIDPATAVKYDFEENNSALGWTGSAETVTPTGFGITVVSTGSDPILRSPTSLGIAGSTHRYIAIEIERLSARTIGAWQGQIYYTTAGHGESELFTKKIAEVANVVLGNRQVIVADMHTLTAGGNDWLTNDITQIRIDLEDGQSGSVTPNGQFRISTIAVGNAIASALSPTTDIIVQEDTDNYRWEIGMPEMRFFWSVRVGAVRFTWFRASSGQAGVNHHLEFALATDIECILRRWKPAHTEIIFDYSPMHAMDYSKPFNLDTYMIMF